MKLTQIRTGFLTGNLFAETDGIDEEASIRKYRDALQAAIQEEYPGVHVDVLYQRGQGCLPHDMKTTVQFDDFDARDDEQVAESFGVEESVSEAVDRISSRIYEKMDWLEAQ